MIKKISFINFLPALFALILAIGSVTVFKACAVKPDGSWMKCHHVQNLVFIFSLVLFALSLASALLDFFINKKFLSVIMFSLSAATALLIFLLPGIILPMCMVNTMRCYAVMQPFVRVVCILEIVFNLIAIIKSLLKK